MLRVLSSWTILVVAGFSVALFGQVLYIPNQADGTISTFVYDQDGGFLTELLPRVPAGGSPTSVTIHPNKSFAFVTNGAGGGNLPSLAAFSIDPANGTLTPAGNAPLTPGSGPQAVVVDPSGRFAFVAHGGVSNGASIVSVFSIDSSTGALTAVPGSPFSTPAGATSVLVHPSGKFAYVSASAAGQIAAYNIGASDGVLTAVSGSPFAARNTIAWMAMDAAGSVLFAAERQDSAILAYSIDAATGALTPVAGSPFSAGNNTFLTGLTVDPAGRFLYVSNGGGTVFVFAIDSGGALTSKGFAPSVIGSFAAILDPLGRFLYVPGTQSNALSAYSIDAGTGALTSLGRPYPTGSNPERGAIALLDPPVLPPMSAEAAFNYHSHSPQGMPNAAIAQGSRLAVTGKNIGPGVEVNTDLPLATQLGGVSVQIQSGGVTTNGLMVYASSGLVTCVVPSGTPLGDATVTVTYKGRTTAPLPITIAAVSVGLRALSDTGYGPAKAWNVPADAPLVLDSSLTQFPNTLHQPAKPGQRIVIQGTGLGPVAADETVDFVQALNVAAQAIVGNKSATVLAEARTAGGSDYFVIQLPDDAPQGCLVPIAIQAGGVTSNVASISISAGGGSCSDETGFAAADIDAAQKSGALNIGVIDINRLEIGGIATSYEASGRFVRYDLNALLGAFAAGSSDYGIRGAFAVPSLGSCTVTPGSPTVKLLDLPGDPTPFQRLNAGPALNLTGSFGTVHLMAPDYYFSTDNDIFTAGDYAVDNGNGAAPFGSFKGVLTMPPPLTWTNKDALVSADRTRDLTVTWRGGLPNQEFAMLAGVAQSQLATAGFLCTAKVSAGQFTIPAWVISSLPASADLPSGGGQTLPGGFLALATAPFTSVSRFSAPGFDFAVFTYEQGAVSLVPYR
jgi:uncharacterized protein (TIGR03437 family)